jgi:hypothetical protein
MSETPQGKRFSQIYLSSPELLPDSKRMRHRLGVLIGATPHLSDFANTLSKELGILASSFDAQYSVYWPPFMAKIELRDVLDAVTIRYHSLRPSYYDSDGTDTKKLKATFLADARRIFAEERIRYRIDDAGGVHFTVDSEFERSRIATLSQLGSARYAGVRDSFEKAFVALDTTPPDGKSAIRSIFFAAEGLFRLMYPSAALLNGSEVLKNLKPQIDSLYDGKKPAIYVAQKQLAAFKEWIDGAHFYRHEPGTEEPAQPPLELAIYMIAQGAAHIRWLTHIDRQ